MPTAVMKPMPSSSSDGNVAALSHEQFEALSEDERIDHLARMAQQARISATGSLA